MIKAYGRLIALIHLVCSEASSHQATLAKNLGSSKRSSWHSMQLAAIGKRRPYTSTEIAASASQHDLKKGTQLRPTNKIHPKNAHEHKMLTVNCEYSSCSLNHDFSSSFSDVLMEKVARLHFGPHWQMVEGLHALHRLPAPELSLHGVLLVPGNPIEPAKPSKSSNGSLRS